MIDCRWSTTSYTVNYFVQMFEVMIYYRSGVIHGWRYRIQAEACNEALAQVQRRRVKKVIVKDRKGNVIFTAKGL